MFTPKNVTSLQSELGLDGWVYTRPMTSVIDMQQRNMKIVKQRATSRAQALIGHELRPPPLCAVKDEAAIVNHAIMKNEHMDYYRDSQISQLVPASQPVPIEASPPPPPIWVFATASKRNDRNLKLKSGREHKAGDTMVDNRNRE
ncbi:hypothetical protein X777_03729, partial [Ooceraea biroi]